MNRSAFVLAVGVVAASLAFFAAFASAAPANQNQGGMGFQGLGARIGFVDPEGASSTVALGVHIDAGEFVHNVHVVPLVEYWKVGVSGIDVRDLTVGSDINVDFPVEGGRLIPYAGGGLGLHFLHADVPAGSLAEPNHTKLGLNIQGGVKNQVMPNLSLFGEVKYAFVSDENQLKVMGGFTYNFIY